MDNGPYKRVKTTPKLYALAIDMTTDTVQVVGMATKKLFPTSNDVKLFAAGERLRASNQFAGREVLLKQAHEAIDRWEEETITRLFPAPK